MNRMRLWVPMVLTVMLFGVAACGQDGGGLDRTLEEGGAGNMPGMEGMSGMPGMAGMEMPAAGSMEEMQSHMETMLRVTPDSMLAMMPEHRQMAANMLAQMNREMQQMNMMGDSAWTATIDSIRQDLVEMPGMSPGQVEAFMSAHQARMIRLVEMHRSMMGNMGR